MIVLMKCLNEERSVRRVLEGIHDEEWVEQIIVIDGGSTDYTIQELNKFEKVLKPVPTHPWIDWYHDMEIAQSNIALSYVPHGSIAFILDFDEKCSDELKIHLADIARGGMPGEADVVDVPRRTYEVFRYEDPYPSPHAIIEGNGWPIISHEIGQYPDYQCRIIKRNVSMHWINSPHHRLYGQFRLARLPEGADLIHYEKDDYRDRDRIEKKWLRAQARRKELGLIEDVFESKVRPERAKYADPDYWSCMI